uniref:Uncharacterized protein n=1 Tax=Strongyloides papillosus TaxID=174720 RepID=A0A0N5CC59_STREA
MYSKKGIGTYANIKNIGDTGVSTSTMTNCFQISGKDNDVKSHVYQFDLDIFLIVIKKNGQTTRVEFIEAHSEGFKVDEYYSQTLEIMMTKFFPLLQHILKQQLGIPEKAYISDFHRLFFTVDEKLKKHLEPQRGVWRIKVSPELIGYIQKISEKLKNVQGASLEFKFATDLDFSYSLFEESVKSKQGMLYINLIAGIKSNINFEKWAVIKINLFLLFLIIFNVYIVYNVFFVFIVFYVYINLIK